MMELKKGKCGDRYKLKTKTDFFILYFEVN